MEGSVEMDLDGHGKFADKRVPQVFSETPEYVRAPAGLPGVRKGDKLNVLRSFVTDHRCPFGEGKRCLVLEKGFMAVMTGTKHGIAWLKM
jgi:hypothetical protein